MRKIFLCLIWLIGVICLIGRPIKARANNIMGIHIMDPAEVNEAAKLVNSSGGDWGWVTIVLRDDDLNFSKWQKFFDDCRRLHLIPIVRIATHPIEGGIWAKPDINDLDKWPDFLGNLNWPVKEQIVVLFNEPNHATEWGGGVNPGDYSYIADSLIRKFNAKNPDFLVLNAGFDQAADGYHGTMTEQAYLTQMEQAVPGIFNQFEGWSSHSYPNHGFVGLPSDYGRATIKGYEWELQEVSKVSEAVYITETGWPHSEGLINSGFYNETTTAEYITQAWQIWNQDEKIKAVTPFVLNFPGEPFDHFSWLKKDGSPYQQYEKVLGISKENNTPEQVESFEIREAKLPEILPTNYIYKGKIKIKNTGQWIMGERNLEFRIQNSELGGKLAINQPSLKQGELVEPGGEVSLDFQVKTGTQSSEEKLMIGDKEYPLYIFRPFDLKNTKVSIWKQIWTKIRLVISARG